MQELFALFHAFFATFRPLLLMYSKLRMQLGKKWGALASLELHSLLQTRNKLVGRQHLVCRSGCGLFRHTKKNLRKSFMLLGSPQLNPCDSCQK